MRINENTALSTSRLMLVPYSACHVPVYHSWMLDEELRDATASDLLTLDSEYEMQRSWRLDIDKLTFIICTPNPDLSMVHGKQVSTADIMVGDINLFLFRLDEEDEEVAFNSQHEKTTLVGELELMIARKDLRRQNYGHTAVLTFLQYIDDQLQQIVDEATGGRKENKLSYLRVKINHSNTASIKLFQKLGFVQTQPKPNYFGEIELRCEEWQNMVKQSGAESAKKLIYQDDAV